MLIQGHLLLDPHRPPTPGWVATEGDRIVEIGEGELREQADAGSRDSLIVPGFIDAHTHLPQIDCIGYDGMELLDWLSQVIFPAEMNWADEQFAHRQAALAYARMARSGTLGYAGFLTSHFHSWAATVRASHALPLRGIAGQVLMDNNCPDALHNDRIARLAVSERGRLHGSTNPRFAVSCTDAMLTRAAELARKRDGAFIQTHLAETQRECEVVQSLFPDDPHYTGVYDRFGLLTPRTLLAHCVHLSEAEWALIARRGSVVVHCPGANTFLHAGVFDFDAAREHEVRVALGSDVAAGPDTAMPRVARAMIEVAKLRQMTSSPQAFVPSPAQAWWMMTRGNAQALGWDDAGHIAVDASADLLVLEVPFAMDAHLISRLLYTWDDAYIAQRIVAGEAVEIPRVQ